MSFALLIVYDDLEPRGRSDAASIEPLLERVASWSTSIWLRDGIDDILSVQAELTMPLENVAPSLRGEHNAPAVWIERLPHRAILREERLTDNPLLETCP